MSYTISLVKEEDYGEVTDLWEASVRATHHFLSEADIRFFRPLVRHEYLRAVALCCIRDEAGEILGFAGVAGNRLEMLFIQPGLRGKGIGKSLLQYVIREKGVQYVDVNEQNPEAVGFYLHEGFQITGRSETDGMGKPFPLLHMQFVGK